MGSFDMTGFEIRPVFLSRLMNDPKTSPLTSTEMLLVKNRDNLLEIENELDSMSLPNFLGRMSRYVSMRDAVFFLLDCYEADMLDVAFEGLQAAFDNEVNLNATDLLNIVKSYDEESIPAHLMVSLLGKDIEEDDSVYHLPKTTSSGLNLDAMRDFK